MPYENENGFYIPQSDRLSSPNVASAEQREQELINSQKALERYMIDKRIATGLINDPSTSPEVKARLIQTYFPPQPKTQKITPGSKNLEAEGIKNVGEAMMTGTDPFEYAKLAGMNEDLADNMSLAMIPLSLANPRSIKQLSKKILKKPFDYGDMRRGEMAFMGNEDNWSDFEMSWDEVPHEWKQLIRGQQYQKLPNADQELREKFGTFMYGDADNKKKPFLVNRQGMPVSVKHGTSNPDLTEFDKYHPEKVDIGFLGRHDAYTALARGDETVLDYMAMDRAKGKGYTSDGKIMEMYTNFEKPFMSSGQVMDNLKETVSKYTMPFDDINNWRRDKGLKALAPEEILSNPQIMGESPHTPAYLKESYRRLMSFEKFLDDNGYDAVMVNLGDARNNPEWEIGIRNSLGKLKERSSTGFDPKIKNVYKAAPFALSGLGAVSQMGNLNEN